MHMKKSMNNKNVIIDYFYNQILFHDDQVGQFRTIFTISPKLK